ncbi:MAG: threonylcarbamoyl-AMP synthase [Candidatus Galacturonibacter soehngenii]|nr:threonylcarbamoyl-AMP synthase [Candidatus Galacturonibacter soehngenii]
MNTKQKKIQMNQMDKKAIQEAAQILRQGGLVAFPTETVYGLGANALDEFASSKIYEAKGRPSDNPLIVHIAELEALNKIVKVVPDNAKKLAEVFWPGPLTMIFEKKEIVPLGTTGGLNTVAVRMPNHALALSLIKEAGGYIAAPSANTSGRPSPTKASHVAMDLVGKIDMILDGGAVSIGIESTIIDVTANPPMILRPGFVTKAMMEAVIGEVSIDPTILGDKELKERPKAPGMKYKHYAPKGDLTIIEGEEEQVIVKINCLAKEMSDKQCKVGIIATDETINRYDVGQVISIGKRSDEQTISHNLYRVLREFDEKNVDVIYSESFRSEKMGMAIMNRLLKAAGHKVIYV